MASKAGLRLGEDAMPRPRKAQTPQIRNLSSSSVVEREQQQWNNSFRINRSHIYIRTHRAPMPESEAGDVSWAQHGGDGEPLRDRCTARGSAVVSLRESVRP